MPMTKARLGYAVSLVAVLLAGIGIGRAQTRPEPPLPGYLHYTPADLDAIQRSLLPKMNALKQSAEQLGDFGNHTAWVAHREADGLMEIHENWADLMFVHSGEATLLLGGTIPDARTDAPGEIRGSTAVGGTRRVIRAGDVVQVPAGMPHQFLVAPGQQITFFTMKIAK
jgi:mannose-6-phosphate isomerase-like protein (cupin superfamily)